MDRFFLILATALAIIAGVRGILLLLSDQRSKHTFWILLCVMCLQSTYLMLRGQMVGACPLRSAGEVSAYLAWALTLFYLIVGPTYRISLLGVFSAPLIAIFQLFALFPGNLHPSPERVAVTTFWGETHSATSVLAYGALALAAVAGVMFLLLDKQLKQQHLKSGLFRSLPPVRNLLFSLNRLLTIGVAILTVGLIAGFLMPLTPASWPHLVAATAIWLGYVVLLLVKYVRGLTGRTFAVSAVVLFVASLFVFGVI